MQIWDSNMFSHKVMTTWTVHPEDDKTYSNAGVYFNEEMNKLKAYKATSGNTSSNFSSINAVSKVNALVLKQANEHTFPIRELRNTATEEQ